MQITLAPHAISPIVREACETFSLAAHSKGIELATAASDHGLVAECDRDRISQVLANLLSNAVKYTPTNGKISIETKREGPTIRFSIRDTGAGMSADKISTIFDKFAQLPSKDRTGLGLGLYISKNIVEAHGSKLSVESSESKGTTMSFELKVSLVPPSIG